MAGGPLENGNKTQTLLIIMGIAMGSIGSFGTINSTDLEDRFNESQQNLDTTLQREMRLLTAPIDVRVAELGDDQDNMRDRINQIETIAAQNRAYIEDLQKDIERLKGLP